MLLFTSLMLTEPGWTGLGRLVPEALKQYTANFLSGGVFHRTSPVFPFPQLLSDVIRGTTAVFSATQPNLLGTIKERRTKLRNIETEIYFTAIVHTKTQQ